MHKLRITTVISLAAIMLLSGLLTSETSISSPATTLYNPPPTSNPQDLVLFDLDFSHETLGTMPDMAYYGYSTEIYHENLTIESAIPAYWAGGLALHLKAEGQTPGSVSMFTSIGHSLSGIVSASWQFSLDDYFWTSYPWAWGQGQVAFGLAVSAGNPSYNAILSGYNTTHGQIWYAGGAASHKVLLSSWHTLNCIFDTDADTIKWYLDGVLEYSQSQTLTTLGYITIQIKKHNLGDEQLIDVYMDNIRVSQTTEYFTTLGDPEDNRTAYTFIFDDGYLNTSSLILPIFGEDPACTALITYYTNTETDFGGQDVMGWDEVNDLLDAGWEIMSHSYSHVSLGTVNETTQRYQIETAKEDIEENNPGYECKGFIYPASSRNAQTDGVVYEYHEYLRASGIDLGQITINSKYTTYGLELQDWGYYTFGLNSMAGAYSHYGYLTFMGHCVFSGHPTGTYDIGVDALAQWISRLQTNDTRIVTPSEYWRDWRNSWQADISDDGGYIDVAYPDDSVNRTGEDRVWLRVPEGWAYGPDAVSLFTPNDAYSYCRMTPGEYYPLMNISHELIDWPLAVNITAWDSSVNLTDGDTVAAWTMSCDEADELTVYLYGLAQDVGYIVYADEDEIYRATSVDDVLSFELESNASDIQVLVYGPYDSVNTIIPVLFMLMMVSIIFTVYVKKFN